ncbi:hypothetical protein [Parapedobacter tibetensis]|uniref:hypothetical protein n=1 Tax=Parapedobacter tibetensis TaxID=2972951 RepID=UPI00214D1C9F|nr:hypothetical protein [Parapedobacter tibetensis]
MNRMKNFASTILLVFALVSARGQQIPLPDSLPQGHPRLMATAADKPVLQALIKKETWAGQVLQGIRQRIDPYLERTTQEPDWLLSRLMMYWKSKASAVYIRGGVYDHAEGEAPVPTVRFGSTRGVASPYKRPQLEDIIPYMDDTKGVFFHNASKPGSPLEWVEQANVSGSNIESVNEGIIRICKDAAFVYWITGDERYAQLAFAPFDTYMLGMHYRDEPIDLSNGHAQTLVGLSTFEVIQERVLAELAYLYDFLFPFIEAKYADKLPIYAETFKKWVDITIKNGVPQNNWNLHQAKFILKVAMVLEDNAHYGDGKGREHYINQILNVDSPRQWSLRRFMDYGYDEHTGVWNECPGYAQGVTRDLTNFIRDYDNTFKQDLLPYAPVMKTAVAMLPQYLFPNDQITAFGDTYYGSINTEAMSDMIRMAQKYGDREDETYFTKLYKTFEPQADRQGTAVSTPAPQIASFFTSKPLLLDSSVPKGELTDFITPTFYAPNVSWFVQRSHYSNRQHGLMISQYASLGNHAHANGVAMELYGKGFVLGPESGIGSSYFEKPYLEYYSQFPAHNTVMVDGISKYPEMLSNHPFDLLAHYPQSGQKDGYYPNITYSEVYFLEPESRSDQNRLLSIVGTSDSSGYYVDIFRSKKQRGGDKFHDYFYHNLGQELFIRDMQGRALDLQPSEKMAFAGGHLFALDYLWDKKSAKANGDYRAIWKMAMPDSNHIYMNLWMKGCEGREVFSIKAPPAKSFRGNHGIPYEVDKAPFLTMAARQHGEAWNHPFVSIFEPTTEAEGSSIARIESFAPTGAAEDFVGLVVTSKSGREDLIFSSVAPTDVTYSGIELRATYAVVSRRGQDFTLFMGNGKRLIAHGFTIEAKNLTNAVLEFKNGTYYVASDGPITVETQKGKRLEFQQEGYHKVDF